MNYKIITLILSLSITTTILSQVQFAYASGYWTLTVNLDRTEFGVRYADIAIHGPYGDNGFRTVKTGPSAYATFTIPDNAIPIGEKYEVCVKGSALSYVFPNCKFYIHQYDDEVVSMVVP